MSASLKYAVVEREHRYLLPNLPHGVIATKRIRDRYVTGTRLRLREVHEDDGTVVRKKRHVVHRDGWVLVVDEHEDGTLIAEIDDQELASRPTPPWLDVVTDVSDDERRTGSMLAR